MTKSHHFPIRVYWEDTDAAGIVYYANYLKFLERARSDFVRDAGVNQRALFDNSGIIIPVKRCEIDYLQPARLDDEIQVHTEITALRGASIDLDQEISRDKKSLVRAKIWLACVGKNGRPRRLPPMVRTALSDVHLIFRKKVNG